MLSKGIENVQSKIIAVLQGNTDEEHKMNIGELTERVYNFEKYSNGKREIKWKNDYYHNRTIQNGIIGILKNYEKEKDYPIIIYGPRVVTHKTEKTYKEKTTYKYIDENGKRVKNPVYKEKKICVTLTEADYDIDNCICLSNFNTANKNNYPELAEWKICYKQPFTTDEAFVIFSSLMNQKNIQRSKIETIVDKLVKSTSNIYFQKLVKEIDIDSAQLSIADEYSKKNGEKLDIDVMKNIENILQAIKEDKKITFERIYYSCNYNSKT